MRIHRQLAFVAGLFVCGSGTAAAQGASQSAGKVGLTMGYPAGIGIQWHVSNKVAIRPEISFSSSMSETTTPAFETDHDSWTIGTNISALFYLSTDDRLRTYVAPRFGWSRVSSTNELPGPIINPLTGETFSESTTTGDGYTGTGSFGAQYSLGDKFVVFGEFGLNFGHSKTTSNLSAGTSTTNVWGTRTAVGVVFYP